MKIAVLAWGSLIWDPRTLEVAAPFKAGGPNLPIEFCRISKNRRLTLVIDEAYGTLCGTYLAPSRFEDLEAARANLRVREEMSSVAGVGYALVSGERSARALELHPHATETIADWAAADGYDAAIWTALESNFEREAAEPFSVNAAQRFLEDLERNDFAAFERALDYIRRAPEATQTPLRERVAAQWPG